MASPKLEPIVLTDEGIARIEALAGTPADHLQRIAACVDAREGAVA